MGNKCSFIIVAEMYEFRLTGLGVHDVSMIGRNILEENTLTDHKTVLKM
jgi:hypothetical protein